MIAAPLAKPLARPLARGLVLGSLDPDAVAWIDAVMAAGGVLFSTESATKKLASDYFAALKTDSTGDLYSLLGRIYFPVWQAAAANAICAKSLTSGTFVGTVTHGVGFVQGDGSTGYFDPGASGNLQTLGLGGNNLHYMLGVSLGGSASAVPIGAWDGNTDRRCQITNEITTNINRFSNPAGLITSTVTLTDASLAGILVGSSTSFSSRYIHRRKTSGTTVNSNTINENRPIPNLQPFILSRNDNGVANLFYNGRVFAASYGVSLSQTQAEAYSLILKDFYESLTGLTIP